MGYDIFDINYLRKRTASIHCGRCRVKYPTADKTLLALVTRSRIVNIIDDPLQELLAEFDWNELDLSDALGESQVGMLSDFGHHVVPAKETVARVFRVVRDPKAVKEDDVREQIKNRRPQLTDEELETVVNEEIVSVYSTRSQKRGRLGMIEVTDDEEGNCNVECYNCGSWYMIDRVEAGRVAAHLSRHKGVCYINEQTLTVDGSNKTSRVSLTEPLNQ